MCRDKGLELVLTIDELQSVIKRTERGLDMNVHIQPGAKRNSLCGLHGHRIKIAVKERAVDGAANEGLCQFLSQIIGTRRADVLILKGEKSRQKTISLLGDSERLIERLFALLNSS